MTYLRLLIAAMACVFAAGVSADLSMAARQVDLGVTEASVLGTNDDGIGLEVGQQVPDFSLTDHQGEPVAFPELAAEGPLLVVFYRGGWCPYCNLQIRQMTQAYDQFEARGVLPVLISVDKPDAAAMAQRTYEIPFPVLSDPGLAAHNAFEVVLQLDEATVERYRKHGLDLEEWSGRDDGRIAVSSAFLVSPEGVVQWVHTSLDYKTRPSVQQLLDVIDSQ